MLREGEGGVANHLLHLTMLTSHSGRGLRLKLAGFWPSLSSVIWEMSTAASARLFDSHVNRVRSGVKLKCRKWFLP